MLVLKVASFMPVEEFKGRMDEELARLQALKAARGVSEVIYPGYKEHHTELARRERGIPFAEAVLEDARSIGKRHGVSFPV